MGRKGVRVSIKFRSTGSPYIGVTGDNWLSDLDAEN